MVKYPEHIQYIIDNYSGPLQKKLREENKIITTNQVIDVLLACDQSNGKKLVDWLVKTYISGGFRWEDVEIGSESKLAEVLDMYRNHFSQIPRDQRNIYSYKNYGELYTLVKPYLPIKSAEETLGSREIRRRERVQALEESEVLYRSEECIVAIPLTENAAVWWGRGTKWCTAAHKNNYFDSYNRDAPLIVITLMNNYSSGSQKSDLSGIKGKDTEKFQLWPYEINTQFMDAADNNVSPEMIEKNWSFFKPLMEYAVEQNPLFFNSFPEKFRTRDLYYQAIRMDGMTLESLPYEHRSSEIYEIAVKQIGLALEFVPLKYKTAELCRLAIEQNGRALRYVPDKLRTLELCKIAVNQNGSALTYVPAELYSDELCVQAVEQSYRALSAIPKNIRYKFALKAVEQNAKALIFLDYDIQEPEIYSLAISKIPHSIQFIPDEYRTAELCRLAVEMNGICLHYVPKHLLTEELCRLAVDNNPNALKTVPEQLLTTEICRLAVQKDVYLYKYVPVKFKTPEFIEMVCLQLESMQVKKVETEPVVEKTKDWNQSVIVDLKQRLHTYFNDQSDSLVLKPG